MPKLRRGYSIITKPIETLKPYANNPRKNYRSIDLVANSIRKFGFKVPLVIDCNNVIIAGHTRYEACQKLGIKEIPCIVADDLTKEQINAFRLADNKVAEFASWDYDKLKEEISNINMDMSEFGVEDVSLDDIDLEAVLEENVKKGKIVICPKCGKEIEV